MKRVNSIYDSLRFQSRNWKAVVLCIFAATVFWFFNALNKTYTTNLRFPLNFEYDEQTYVPVKSLPSEIRLNVTGNGWELFRRSTGLKLPPLEITLDRPNDTKRIVGSTLPAFFANQLEGLRINFVLTDTIFVDLEPKKGRWIKLRVDTASIRLKQGYGLTSSISVLPDSTFVEGPRPVINNLKDTIALTLALSQISEPYMGDVEVTLPSADIIRRDPPTVAVMFSVAKMITVKDSVELTLINIPKNFSPLIGNRKIPIEVKGPEQMLTQAAIDSLKAVVDVKQVRRGNNRIMPSIINLPPFTEVLVLDSVSVKF